MCQREDSERLEITVHRISMQFCIANTVVKWVFCAVHQIEIFANHFIFWSDYFWYIIWFILFRIFYFLHTMKTGNNIREDALKNFIRNWKAGELSAKFRIYLVYIAYIYYKAKVHHQLKKQYQCRQIGKTFQCKTFFYLVSKAMSTIKSLSLLSTK